MRKYVSILLLCITLFLGKSVLASSSFPSPTGFVNDFANILNTETKSALENKLQQFKTDTSSEVIVVTMNTIGIDSIENYANELFREWGIGTKENNNGVLLLISKEDRKIRIEVGSGLEGALPDITASSIIRNDITPLFKQEKYDEGVTLGIDKIIDATRGEYVATPTKRNFPSHVIEVLFFVFIFGLNIIVSILAPSKSWWLGGVLGAIIGGIVGFFAWSVIGSFIVGGVLLALGLIVDYFVSKNYQKHKNDHDNHSGFCGTTIGSGSSSSGGGFGGFSGGSSGGGGASGSW